MASRIVLCVLAAGVLWQSAGCMIVEGGKSGWKNTWKMFKPRPNDYRDMTEEEVDPWADVGKEGRGHRPLDKEDDGLDKYLMSPKARNIKRNLGVD